MSGQEQSDWRAAAAAEYHQKRDALVRERADCAAKLDRIRQRLGEIDQQIQGLDAAAQAFDLPVSEQLQLSPIAEVFARAGSQRTGKMFKDVAIDILKEAHPGPVRAADLQAEAEKRIGRKFHEKTSGMTLYRLSQEGAARRKGWDWFYVPEGARQPKEEGHGHE